jgi:hypothetical protein
MLFWVLLGAIIIHAIRQAGKGNQVEGGSGGGPNVVGPGCLGIILIFGFCVLVSVLVGWCTNPKYRSNSYNEKYKAYNSGCLTTTCDSRNISNSTKQFQVFFPEKIMKISHGISGNVNR